MMLKKQKCGVALLIYAAEKNGFERFGSYTSRPGENGGQFAADVFKIFCPGENCCCSVHGLTAW